jgi:hypothetical protein
MPDFLTPVISGGLALLGAWLGSTLSARREREERRFRFVKQQLEEFYGPFYALRREIAAKSDLRPRISSAAGNEWSKLIQSIDQEEQRRIEEREWPKYEAIIAYNNEQLRRELLPLYARMLDLFREKMWLAEPSTRDHYESLVDYVELWNRWLAGSLPAAVVIGVAHDESTLQPLYVNVAQELENLRSRLRDKGH